MNIVGNFVSGNVSCLIKLHHFTYISSQTFCYRLVSRFIWPSHQVAQRDPKGHLVTDDVRFTSMATWHPLSNNKVNSDWGEEDSAIALKGEVIVTDALEALFEDHGEPVKVKKAHFKNLCKSSEKETHRMLKVEGEDWPDHSLTSKTPLEANHLYGVWFRSI